MSASASYAAANPIQRFTRRFAGSGLGAWLFARVLQRVDEPIYRLTRGRHTMASLVSGMPVIMLTTTGAKSGQPRSVPLLGLPTADGLCVIASNFGQDRHPAWYYNLLADPHGEVTVDGATTRFRAVRADGEQRARIWQEGLKVYPGWSQYEVRAANRDIAVFVLEPVAAAGP